jgi:hypothetical protein
VILFPARSSLQAYLADDRRQSLLANYGEVFTRKCTVEVETIEPLG